MTPNNFVTQLRNRFIAELQLKTGWGRNELIAKFDQVLIEVLSHQVTQSPSDEETKDANP